ncbi:MAG TPA: DUF3073 domain-containing protein [Candidatus Nanopelagicales bacterium]|jgi:hypothetical protein
MGRGRAKAKQTKVARQLKYGAVHSDLGALQAELGHPGEPIRPAVEDVDAVDEDTDPDDPYAAYLEDEDDDAPTSNAR